MLITLTLLKRHTTIPLLVGFIFLSTGCGMVTSYRKMQTTTDKQKLIRLYRNCVEKKGASDPDCAALSAGIGNI